MVVHTRTHSYIHTQEETASPAGYDDGDEDEDDNDNDNADGDDGPILSGVVVDFDSCHATA